MGLLDASLFLHRKTAWGKRQDVGCARPDVAFVLQPLLLGVRVLRAPRERVYKHVNSASLCNPFVDAEFAGRISDLQKKKERGKTAPLHAFIFLVRLPRAPSGLGQTIISKLG